MALEIVVAGSSLVVAVFAAGGVVMTWRKNGKSQAARDGRIELTQENIIQKLDDPTNGLTAINEKVNRMVNHCATVSTGLTGRVDTAERDIKELKTKAP